MTQQFYCEVKSDGGPSYGLKGEHGKVLVDTVWIKSAHLNFPLLNIDQWGAVVRKD